MAEPESRLTVYTIGHSNLSEDQFLVLLGQHRIELVVDVRSAPFSRFTPHFNRESLRPMLTEAGIQYAYAGEKLGGRPPDPSCYRHGVLPEPGADYLQEVDYVVVEQREWYQAGIRRLRELAQQQRTAIMCSEENPEICHRHHLIARTLLNQGVVVHHIRQGGELTEATVAMQQTDLFASLRAGDG